MEYELDERDRMRRPMGRDGIPRPSRLSERPVTLPVRDSQSAVAAYTSLLTAGADEAEADPAQAVAADPSVIDAERDPLYGDGVQHSTNLRSEGDGDQLGCESVLHSSYSRSVRGIDRKVASSDAGSEAAEALRVARLSRWQEQR